MGQSKSNDIKIIQDFLRSLKEKDLYEPLHSLFLAQGYSAWIVHGSHEQGKDLVAIKPNDHALLISVKRGDIDQHKWKSDVSPSLEEMMKRPIRHTGVEESIKRKPLLVLNGVLIPPVDQKVVDFNEYYKKHDEPLLEVWDINKLSQELYEHLLLVDFFKGDFLEELQRLILSVGTEDIDTKIYRDFIRKYVSLEKDKFNAFRLALLCILRRAEAKGNPYAFFKFAEYTLVKIWELIQKSGDFSSTDKFGDVHQIYLDSLEEWSQSIDPILSKESGLLDFDKNGTLEIILYPLRTFDVIRRIAYLTHFFRMDKEKAVRYSDQLLRILKNNKSSSTPLAEFNYTDIGLALTVLKLTNHDSEARKWLFDLADFLLSQASTGYNILPLGRPSEQIFNIVFSEKPSSSDVQSMIFGLLLEFSVILNAQEVFDIFVPRLRQRLICSELVMPLENEENEIYSDKVINSIDKTVSIPYSWESARSSFTRSIENTRRQYSMIRNKAPLLLIICSNVFRDRLFPQVWREHFFWNV